MKITIKTILTAVTVICALSASAQKKNVLVHSTTGEGINSKDISRIHAAIVEGLSNLPTVNILDVSNDGAETDMHFECNIDSICIYPKKQDNGTTSYVTEINLRAQIYKDGEDESRWSIPLSVYNSMVLKTFTDKKECAQSALEWVPERVERAFWKPFAIQGQMLDVEESKNNKAQKVSVAIGSQQGAAEKQEFSVYLPDPKIFDKNGRIKENQPIGKVKVEDMGDEVSVCKVSGGGDKIYEAFLENPEQLTVMSKAPTKGLIKDKKYQAQYVAENAWLVWKAAQDVASLAGEMISLGKDVKSDVESVF